MREKSVCSNPNRAKPRPTPPSPCRSQEEGRGKKKRNQKTKTNWTWERKGQRSTYRRHPSPRPAVTRPMGGGISGPCARTDSQLAGCHVPCARTNRRTNGRGRQRKPVSSQRNLSRLSRRPAVLHYVSTAGPLVGLVGESGWLVVARASAPFCGKFASPVHRFSDCLTDAMK